MKRLIINGDPGIRKDAIVDYEGEEVRCFSVTRNGDWHGPDRVQLWCIVGDEDERDDFDRQNYIPHHLDVDRVDAEDVDVIQGKGKLSV
ncbi:HAH_0734 family protein [Haloarchaeobius sp. HRN-SO-5]|uniref:HAH_0734 family protein n=1 Tax=Haloarchaeobius sp. HRN-SO-5 TaxID=3446118 RepID=UPI003EB8452A